VAPVGVRLGHRTGTNKEKPCKWRVYEAKEKRKKEIKKKKKRGNKGI